MKNSKLKAPEKPTTPYPPYKPIPPVEKVEKHQDIGVLPVSNYDSFSLSEFTNVLNIFCQDKNVNIDDIKFTFETDKDWCYDDVICNLKVQCYTTSLIDNPHYQSDKKKYDKLLEKYNKDYAQYEVDKKSFNSRMKEYKKAYDLYLLEYNKKEVIRLEKKVKDQL